ncbi:MAG: hypothetical protein IK081_15270 [Lachnospiraceae bacterium]|nr:hypothetical protein [Lachnospiraceae bacterium]
MHLHPVLKKNAFRALFYAVVSCTVTYALGVPIVYGLGILVILIGAGIVADYAERTVVLRKWHLEIWMSCFLFVPSAITYFWEDLVEKFLVVGNYIIVSGILLLLADQFWAFGMERMLREVRRLQARTWRIWKYASVIVGIFCIHVDYDISQNGKDYFVTFDQERIALAAYALLAFVALRCIQAFLMVCMLDAMTDPEEPEATKKEGSIGKTEGERSKDGEQ